MNSVKQYMTNVIVTFAFLKLVKHGSSAKHDTARVT